MASGPVAEVALTLLLDATGHCGQVVQGPQLDVLVIGQDKEDVGLGRPGERRGEGTEREQGQIHLECRDDKACSSDHASLAVVEMLEAHGAYISCVPLAARLAPPAARTSMTLSIE